MTVVLVLQASIVCAPALNGVFRTDALSAAELAMVLAASCVVFAAVEVEKWRKRTRGATMGLEAGE